MWKWRGLYGKKAGFENWRSWVQIVHFSSQEDLLLYSFESYSIAMIYVL